MGTTVPWGCSHGRIVFSAAAWHMGAHYCTNGGTQRAARDVAPCRHTAATHRCPPLPSAAHCCHFYAHAMPQLYSSMRSWAMTPFSFYSKDARLPVQLQRAMAAEAEAAREARAKACCCVATPDTTEHHSTYMLSFFLPLSFRLLLQRANKKPRELSKRPRRSFPSRHLPSSSVTCRYDIRLPCSSLQSAGLARTDDKRG